TFQITEIFPEMTVRENIRIPVEVQAGLHMSTRMPAHLRGPLVGAAIYVVLQDYLSSVVSDYWQFFVGLVFVAVVLFFPRGFMGALRRRTAE
ncbi:MAG: hypothetical protein KGI94_15120, partial [Paracoccaceae bacterium]|nr:hypothetical protein [Paracoccaceae bacterium]